MAQRLRRNTPISRPEAQQVALLEVQPLVTGTSSKTPDKREIATLPKMKRMVSSTRVEIVVPSWLALSVDDIPVVIREAFGDTKWFEAGGSNSRVIFGCDLCRGLRDEEDWALSDAWESGQIRDYEVLAI